MGCTAARLGVVLIALLLCGGVCAAPNYPIGTPKTLCKTACDSKSFNSHYQTPACKVGCGDYMVKGGTLAACISQTCKKMGSQIIRFAGCSFGCNNFHSQPCYGNGFQTNPAWKISDPRWADKCLIPTSSTTRAVAVAGCATVTQGGASNRTSDCDARGGGNIAVRFFGAGCAHSTPRPTITLGDGVGVDALLCTNVRATTVVPDPGCHDAMNSPQAFACTLPALTNTALLGVPLAVRVKWLQNTTVRHLAELAGSTPTNVTAMRTTNAISEAAVSYSCVDRTCNPTGAPLVVWIEGCGGDQSTGGVLNSKTDPTATSNVINRRARFCSREGGSRITVHGFFLGTTDITVGGQPCRDAVHDSTYPEEIVTCVLPCPAGNRDEWIVDTLRRAKVDRAHRSFSSWLAACIYGGLVDGIIGGHKYSDIDAKAQDGGTPAGWCAAVNNDNQYLEFDLGSLKVVAGVVTQGRADASEWVKGMTIEIAGTDHVFTVAAEFGTHVNENPVNTDRNTKVDSTFPTPRYAQYVRIVPKAYSGHMSLRADVLLGYVGGGYNGSSNAQHVVACNTFGCSPTAENTRITYGPAYDPSLPHLCYHAPELESVAIESATSVSGTTLTFTGRGFGAGAPMKPELKAPLLFRYGVATDAVCDLTESGRVVQWSQTLISLNAAGSAGSGCATMLSNIAALTQPDLLSAKFQLQLGGAHIACFPLNVPCIHSVSGCAESVPSDDASTAACLVEGGAMLTIRGRNLDPTKIRLASKELVESAAKVPTTSALTVVNFTAGGAEPTSLFALRPTSDKLIATLPCLFPREIWSKAFSLVSSSVGEGPRSIPTLSYNDDYDATTPHLCYLAPTIQSIAPSVVQQGDVVTIHGENFGAVSPKASKNKVELLGKKCFVIIGKLESCASFSSWSATVVTFSLCNGVGYHLPVTLHLGDHKSVLQGNTSSTASELSYLIVAPMAEQPRLASLSLRSPGTVDISFFAPSDTFNAVSKTRAWIPEDYTVEWAASVTDFPVECGNATKWITIDASSDPTPSTLPLLDATIVDTKLLTLGATRALRIGALKRDKGIPKRMCTEPIAFDVAQPPAAPQNLSVSLGNINAEGTQATFLVNFRTSLDFGGRPMTACSYTIEFVVLGGNASSSSVTRKTVPALPGAEQTELVTKMTPNTKYDAVVHSQCKVDPPAQGIIGVLHGNESNHDMYGVEPHRVYALQCAETGDFSTLVDTTCISCPTEAEGAQCILGLLSIRKGYWMPDVSLARAIETREAMKTLIWKCKTSEACGSIPATIEDGPGPTAVPRSVCGVGFKGNLCGACANGYGPLGAGCLVCPEWYVNFSMAFCMVLWIVLNIGWQTYNTYSEARKRGQRATAGITEAKTASVVKVVLDYCQLVAALSFIKIDPPTAVRRLFSVFALGSGVSANAMPAQCLLGWGALSQTWFYIATAYIAMLGPLLLAVCYWFLRYVRSRMPTWWAVGKARYAAWREGGAGVPEEAKAAGNAGDDLQPPPAMEVEEEEEEAALPPMEEEEEVQAQAHRRRRRRSSLINTLTESVAESDVSGDVPGPALQKLHRRYAEVVTDPSGLATYNEFTRLVGAAAPSRAFVEGEWEDYKDEKNTISFDDFRVVMKKIELRQTIVIVVTATVVAVFFNYMKVSTQLVAIFVPSDVIDGSMYLSTDWDVPAYTLGHIATMIGAAITLIIFTFGAPTAALTVLIHMNRKDRLVEPEIFTMFGFLYAGYKPKYFWWESVVLLRKVAATVIALAPIGIELQAICAASLLGLFTMLQLTVRPFKNERHNVMDCSAMGSIALKQLCALAYHHATTNAVDTIASQQLVTVVSWVVSAVVLSTSFALVVFFVLQFMRFKLEEMNEDRLIAVTAEHYAWRTGALLDPTKLQLMLTFLNWVTCGKCCTCGRGAADEGEGEEAGVEEEENEEGDGVVRVMIDAEDMPAAEAAAKTALGKNIEKFELNLRGIDDEIDDHCEGMKAAQTRREAAVAEHNKVIALRLIDGEEVDGNGFLMMTREPLTMCELIKAKLRCCTCRKKLFALFNTVTGEVQDSREQLADLAAAAIVPAGGADAGSAGDDGTGDDSDDDGGAGDGGAGFEELQLTATLNPFGIAMQALQRPLAVQDSNDEDDDDGGGSFAFVPPGGFHSSGTPAAPETVDASEDSDLQLSLSAF